MIKHELTFVSGVQESVLVDFISQNKGKILYKVKSCQNCLIKNFLTLILTKMKKTYIFCIFFLIFELLSQIYAQF